MRRGRMHAFFATARAYAGPLFAVALITLAATASLVGGQRAVVTRTSVAFDSYMRQHASTTWIISTTTMTTSSAADQNQAIADSGRPLSTPDYTYTAVR